MRNVFQYSIKRFDSEIRTLIDLHGPSDRHSTSPPPLHPPRKPSPQLLIGKRPADGMEKREKWFQIV